jgi:ATP synthase protein I
MVCLRSCFQLDATIPAHYVPADFRGQLAAFHCCRFLRWIGNKMADDLDARRASLEKRLSEQNIKAEDEKPKSNGKDAAGMAQAVKLSSEFIAGVVVGAGLGWGLDQIAGTSPFGLIVLLLLGFCAGVLNVLRTIGAVAPPRIDEK